MTMLEMLPGLRRRFCEFGPVVVSVAIPCTGNTRDNAPPLADEFLVEALFRDNGERECKQKTKRRATRLSYGNTSTHILPKPL